MDKKQAEEVLLQLIEQSMATGFFKSLTALDMCRQAVAVLKMSGDVETHTNNQEKNGGK
jgi:hypothetical protein